MKPRILVVGYLSIDTCETPTMRHDDVPGGAGLYAALAAARSGADVTLAAACGEDYPPVWLASLREIGIDMSLVERRGGATRRARLRYTRSGERDSAHHGEAQWWERTQALAPPVPDSFAGVDAVVMCAMPADHLGPCIARARDAAAISVFDTSAVFVRRDRADLLALLDAVDIFAASIEETRLLLPELADDAAALRLAGAQRRVLQKRGARGAVAVDGMTGSMVALAAPPADVIDPTGAGDATVGALAVSLAAGEEFIAAARAALLIGALSVSGIGPAALGFAPPMR